MVSFFNLKVYYLTPTRGVSFFLDTGVSPDGTPMANVMLSLMHTLGHDDMDSFGDSTGPFH